MAPSPSRAFGGIVGGDAEKGTRGRVRSPTFDRAFEQAQRHRCCSVFACSERSTSGNRQPVFPKLERFGLLLTKESLEPVARQLFKASFEFLYQFIGSVPGLQCDLDL